MVLTATLISTAILSGAATAEEKFVLPRGLDEIVHPEDNPPSAEKIALGKQLYWDRRLSSDRTVACVDCHHPKKGWSNADQFATGVGLKKGGRNSPTVLNSVFNRFQFWDGRAGSLEDQALGPIQNPIEMAMTDKDVVDRLNAIPGYRKQFQQVFGTDVNFRNIGKAIAAYERTIVAGDAPYDRFKEGDKTALSEEAQRGMKLFFGKAVCSSCHSGANFTDNAFHNIGIGMDQKEPDPGRAAISKLEGDTGSFKTPGLRDIARSAPYMHDGSMKTLKEVVEHYNKGGIDNPYLDEEIFPLELTDQEVAEAAFMAIYSRRPTDAEVADIAEFLKDHGGDRSKAVSQVAWALLASTEYCVNH